MILTVKETNKELYSAKFEILHQDTVVGNIDFKGKMGSMEGEFEINFNNNKLKLIFNTKGIFNHEKMFRPYLIINDEQEEGEVYQTKYKAGFLNSYEYIKMIYKEKEYNMYSIGLGKEGIKSPIYANHIEIAQIEKENVVYDDLHSYDIYAIDEFSALISVILCSYMFVNGCYKPGQKVTNSVVKSVNISTNKLLKEKYNPDFKNKISQ